MPWTRYIYQPPNLLRNYLVDEIHHHLRRCKLGQQPLDRNLPFIMTEHVATAHLQVHNIHKTIADIKGAAAHTGCLPHYQTFWIRTNGYTMTPDPKSPVFLSRTWIHERNGGLNWLTAMQIVDAADMPLIVESNWSPYKPQLQ